MKKYKLPTYILVPLDDERIFVLHTKDPKFIGEVTQNESGHYSAEVVTAEEKTLVNKIMDKAVSVVPKEQLSDEFKQAVYSTALNGILEAMAQWYFFSYVNNKTKLTNQEERKGW